MVRMTLAQMRVVAGQPAVNLATMRKEINQARQRGSQLIVFPELALPGYFIGDAWERSGFLLEIEEAHEQLRAESNDIAIIFGSLGIDHNNKNEDGRVRKYNGAFICQNGCYLVHPTLGLPFWPKTLLPQYRQFDDSRHFFDLRKYAWEAQKSLADVIKPVKISFSHPGGAPTDLTIGILICEDMWDDDYQIKPMEILAHQCNLMINISASPYAVTKPLKRFQVLARASQRTGRPFLYVNAVGVQNTGKVIYGFDGGSALCPFSTQGNKNSSDAVGVLGTFFQEESFDVNFDHHTLTVTPAPHNVTRCVDSSQITCPSAIQALQKIVAFVCAEWRLERAVIGVSGGIDSAVSAVLMVQILGAQQVLLVNMPSRFNSQLTQDAAQQLARGLGTAYEVLPIESLLKSTQDIFARSSNSAFESLKKGNGLVFENLQARLRGSTLLATAAALWGGVFPCNANKAELTVGYGTLYGDLGGFLCPLGDLWKHQVKEAALEWNRQAGFELIPRATLEVQPSAELSSDQDVTQGKGDPLIYSYHDALFRYWIESWNRPNITDIKKLYESKKLESVLNISSGTLVSLFPEDKNFYADLLRWWNLYTGMGAVKRVQAPPICAVSRRPFGFDHRENI